MASSPAHQPRQTTFSTHGSSEVEAQLREELEYLKNDNKQLLKELEVFSSSEGDYKLKLESLQQSFDQLSIKRTVSDTCNNKTITRLEEEKLRLENQINMLNEEKTKLEQKNAKLLEDERACITEVNELETQLKAYKEINEALLFELDSSKINCVMAENLQQENSELRLEAHVLNLRLKKLEEDNNTSERTSTELSLDQDREPLSPPEGFINYLGARPKTYKPIY